MATSTRLSFMPDDVLTAILELARQLMGSGASLAFRGHDDELQKIFFELGKGGKRSLLRSFVFSDSGPRPYSPTLSDSVSKLQLAGLLGRRNPDYEVIYTTSAASEFYEKVLSKKFSNDEIAQLKEVAKDFLSQVTPV